MISTGSGLTLLLKVISEQRYSSRCFALILITEKYKIG